MKEKPLEKKNEDYITRTAKRISKEAIFLGYGTPSHIADVIREEFREHFKSLVEVINLGNRIRGRCFDCHEEREWRHVGTESGDAVYECVKCGRRETLMQLFERASLRLDRRIRAERI